MSTIPPDCKATASLPKVLTATVMRRLRLDGEARPLSPNLDLTVKYAGHWWLLDGTDAWVRVTDPKAVAIIDAHEQRSAAIFEALRSRPGR